MAAGKPLLGLASLILTAGACLLLFLVILCGANASNPLPQFWLFRASTDGISSAPPVSTWTLWNTCDGSSGLNANCGPVKPAHPFDPPRNFDTEEGIPPGFVGTRKFYFLSRFAFAFILMALFFAVCSLFTGLLALCTRIGGAISGLLASFALFWQALAASLLTANYVIGRDNFRREGRDASLGIKAFAFLWTVVACLLLSTVLFFMILATGKKNTSSSRGGMFGRKRSTKSTRSRGSFIDKDTDASSFERAR
ncbi:MAG: hypothetical protein M1817_003825 [Caeruleum heppii]|nr:MAG: hypothetical protein M1817_003825 [Caeruleum heppii]